MSYQLLSLHHCLIITDRLEETKNFYVDVIGLRVGDRPFSPPGYWLYLDNIPVIHLAGGDVRNPSPKDRTPALFRDLRKHVNQIEHMAFRVTGYADLIKRLVDNHVSYNERAVPESGDYQVFFTDPNGVGIEMNLDLVEVKNELESP
jgi:catechol 2,3-dioxygenase-like lactoylglutathione lyase family enzyme